MTIDIKVTNAGPATTTQTHQASLGLFRRYCEETYGVRYDPFEHQAEVFQLVGKENRAVMLVAGTAAGKTLALSVPIFHKLVTGRIRRVLLMYPTIALMNDQRRVMDRLAELTDQEVGLIQGGMKRTALVAALNKPVIVATPDAIYWFFQKNVKYSGLLIYGLSLIDEFVLDEAHLFNGLTLRNIKHLKDRILALSNILGRTPRWHILTATPTRELRDLVPQAVSVQGLSKCGDVHVRFAPPVEFKERSDNLIQMVESALASDAKKVLLVLNSAAGAHRLFEDIRGAQPLLSEDLQLRFGRVVWGQLRQWMTENQIAWETISKIAAWLKSSGTFRLADLQPGYRTHIPTETLMEKASRFLQNIARRIKDAAYEAGREAVGAAFLTQVAKRLQDRDTKALWSHIQEDLTRDADPDAVKRTLNMYLTRLSDGLNRVWQAEALVIRAPEFPKLAISLKDAGFPPVVADALFHYLRYSIELNPEEVRQLRSTLAALDRRVISLRWLREKWLIEDATERQALAERIEMAMTTGELKVETRHITTWGESAVPMVIYTGQMSRHNREGLIEAFDEMERAVLVSTSAVEVGVDFKAEVLITEACDGNGFLQRFGRVGRTGVGPAEVYVLLREGETWTRLQQQHRDEMSREAFSWMIIDPDAPTDPERSLLPDRTYATVSVYQDATHWLVNRQIGRMGRRLNAAMFSAPQVSDLACEMEEADVPFAYGLRGTLPGISLLGGGGGSPFYILSKVHDEKLAPSSSPFEMAEAQMGYTQFLYTKREWNVDVDWVRTLAASRAMFYLLNGEWRVETGYGIAKTYILALDFVRKAIGNFQGDLSKMQQQLAEVKNPHIQAILRLGRALRLYNAHYADFVLGQGDVFLKRLAREDKSSKLVRDQWGNPLVLSDQLWLYLGGNINRVWQTMREKELDALSEVRYPHLEQNPILLDEVAGGCFYIYERLVSDAD